MCQHLHQNPYKNIVPFRDTEFWVNLRKLMFVSVDNGISHVFLWIPHNIHCNTEVVVYVWGLLMVAMNYKKMEAV